VFAVQKADDDDAFEAGVTFIHISVAHTSAEWLY